MTGTATSATIAATARAASSVFTVTRTSSLPAACSARTCAAVAATSAVSVLVIDWTTIGWALPTSAPPTLTVTVGRRVLTGTKYSAAWRGARNYRMLSCSTIRRWMSVNRSWPDIGAVVVVSLARMPTHRESLLNIGSDNGSELLPSGTVWTPETGPLESARNGVPVNSPPCVCAKNTSRMTLPAPVAFSSDEATVAVTESTLEFPNPGGIVNRRDIVESNVPVPRIAYAFVESLADKKLSTSTLRMTLPLPQAATNTRRAAVRAFIGRPLINRNRRGQRDGALRRQ